MVLDGIKFSKFITKGLEFSKDDPEHRTFTGYITAEVVDRQNEIIAVNEVLKIMDTFMKVNPVISEMHTNRVVGKVNGYQKAEIEGHLAVKISAEIYKIDGVTLYDNVWQKLLNKEYQGLSMGGSSKVKEPIVENGQLVFKLSEIELYEIALCPTPANQLAIIDHVNELAKAIPDKNMLKDMDGRMIIQCDSVQCLLDKATAIDSDVDIDVDHSGGNPKKKTTMSGFNINIEDSADKDLKKYIEHALDCKECANSLKKDLELFNKPFAGYKDFEACERANKDKGDTGAYCGKIKHQVEDTKKSVAILQEIIRKNNL